MKKVLIGFILGAILSSSLVVSANTMIGKTIDNIYPLFIDGKRVNKDVIVIEGTSYLPVKVSGESFGYDVKWDSVNKQVLMEKQTTEIQSVGETTMNDKELFRSSFVKGKINSNTLKLNKDIKDISVGYMLIDNEYYLKFNTFSDDYIKNVSNKKTININGAELEIIRHPDTETYIPGMDYIIMFLTPYVKISYFGLTSEVINGELWIELPKG